MQISDTLQKSCLIPRLTSTSKMDVILELIDALDNHGLLPNRTEALMAVLEREKEMSTGMQHGVAIPHGKTDSVGELVTVIGLQPGGIDFDSLDGKPSCIFVMTLSPIGSVGPHMKYLADISKLLDVPRRREQLLAATTAAEMLDALASD